MSVNNTHYGYAKIEELLRDCRGVYFIGIGGINMSSLAHITKKMGYAVGGSDRVCTALTQRLELEGIDVKYTHSEELARGYDAFVYTVAIGEDNPEYVYAHNAGRPCISRADYLGYLMTKYKRRVGISGMHGKSTCTSMCAQIMVDGGYSPTVLSGAELAAMGGAYTVGESENFVFEACEYMDSFLDFNPTVAVVLNIEMDHVDYFKSMEQIRKSYASYASIVGEEGYVIYNADDREVVSALENVKANKISFGLSHSADIYAEDISHVGGKPEFDIIYFGDRLTRVRLGVSGEHNIYNALAATTACLLCGVSAEDIRTGLAAFSGAARRMEYKGDIGGVHIYDDYAHHPTEIAATLKGAKQMASGKLWCVYQPHTYSRTAALLEDFAAAFGSCDNVIFVDIYPARETNIYGVSSEQLATLAGEHAMYADSFERAAQMIKSRAVEGDTAIIMGAGDVYKVFSYFDFDDKG